MKNSLPVYPLTSHGRPFSEGLVVVTLAEIKANTQHLSNPHRHDFYAFQLFKTGTGQHHIDAETLPIAPGTLFYVGPGQVHAWYTDAPPEGYALLFTAAFWLEAAQTARQLEQTGIFPKPDAFRLVLTEEDSPKIEAIFERLYVESRQQQPGKALLLRAYLTELLIALERIPAGPTETASAPSKRQLVARFESLVQEEATRQRSVGFYADQLAVSPDYLNSLTRVYVGKTASDLIHEHVLTEADRLLAHTDLSVAEIAYALHFSEPSQFVKYFKRYTGQTPRQRRSALTAANG